jgi:hypothetical protein
MRGQLRRGVLAALCAGVFASQTARAQDLSAPRADSVPPALSRAVVDVTVAAGGNDAGPLVETIRELLGRLGINVNAQLVAHSGSPAEAASDFPLARVRIDLESPREAKVLVYGRTGEVALRQSFARDASPAVVREEVADAVRSAVEAQLLRDPQRAAAATAASAAPAPAEAPIVSTPPPPPAPPAAPPTPSPAPEPPAAEPPQSEAPPTPPPAWLRGLALDVTALAGAGPYAGNAVLIPRIGGGVTVASRRWLRPSLTVTGEYMAQFNVSSPSPQIVTAQVSNVSVRAIPAIQIFHASWIAVDVGVGGGGDVLTVERRSAPTGSILGQSTTSSVEPILCGVVAGHLGLTPGVALTLAVGSDVDVAYSQLHYLVGNRITNVPSDVLSPWRVRPFLLAGFAFTALGERRFSKAVIQ